MKTLWAAISLVFLLSCKKETTAEATTTVTVIRNNCTQQFCNSQNFKICFDSLLEESRCPSNANCIWEGVAKAKFRFVSGSEEHIVRLSTLILAPNYNTDTTIAGFHIKLINILPYPVYPVDPQTQITATVEITQ